MLSRRVGRKLLVPFFTVGYPDYKTSLQFVRVGLDAGADMIELGMPFSDPMADGPDIQLSSQVALAGGTNMHAVLRAVESVRILRDIPLVLMGYYNPVLAYGTRRFACDVARAGGDGLIIPDLPVEEAGELRAAVKKHRLSAIFLVAPTSSSQRVRTIDRASDDFVYAVTVTGVTGGRSQFNPDTDKYMRRLRSTLTKPFVAGFGVSSPQTALRLARHADGVVIGSALIKTFRAARTKKSGLQAVDRLLRGVRAALNGWL
jgi:tryptophan synthase alpha chain